MLGFLKILKFVNSNSLQVWSLITLLAGLCRGSTKMSWRPLGLRHSGQLQKVFYKILVWNLKRFQCTFLARIQKMPPPKGPLTVENPLNWPFLSPPQHHQYWKRVVGVMGTLLRTVWNSKEGNVRWILGFERHYHAFILVHLFGDPKVYEKKVYVVQVWFGEWPGCGATYAWLLFCIVRMGMNCRAL